jgi:hypothetical protein
MVLDGGDVVEPAEPPPALLLLLLQQLLLLLLLLVIVGCAKDMGGAGSCWCWDEQQASISMAPGGCKNTCTTTLSLVGIVGGLDVCEVSDHCVD